MAAPWTIARLDRLTPADARAVATLAESATGYDGSPPLNDEALLHLTDPGDHLLARDAAATVAGYAQVDRTDTAQLVVDPAARRHGLGTALVGRLLTDRPAGLRAWAFGDGPGAQALARRHGFRPLRTLLRMERPLDDVPATPDPPAEVDGFTFRSYRPGDDAEAWVAVNAAAFAHHPEQGRMTVADVAAREAADWFDPDGFLLAERDGRLVGFHWTKSHGVDERNGQVIGEVYVLGVHPDAEGRGLGRILLERGLDRLRSTGHTRVILYVEGDQTRVVRLYTAAGFTVAARDVQYSHDAGAPTAQGAGWT